MLIDETRFRYLAISVIEEYLNKRIDEDDIIINFIIDEMIRRAKDYYSNPINQNIKSQTQGQRSVTYVDNINNPFVLTDDLKSLLPPPSVRLI